MNTADNCPVSTLNELKQFYCAVYTPLYDRFVNEGAVAQELHSEVAAAFDHLICGVDASSGELNRVDYHKVAGHLKRATFDGFKLVFENQIRLIYNHLMSDCYAEVHDGRFRQEISKLWENARTIAAQARNLERKAHGLDYDVWDQAFKKWNEIIPIADEFIRLQTDETVVRAKRKSRRQKIVSLLMWLCNIVLGAIIAFVLNRVLECCN